VTTWNDINAAREDARRRANELYLKDAPEFPTLRFNRAKIAINDHGAAVSVNDYCKAGSNALTIDDLVSMTSELAELFPDAARAGLAKSDGPTCAQQ
jgi:hypothetical protein